MSQKFALIESLEALLPLAFTEDHPDITAEATCEQDKTVLGNIFSRDAGVICGLPFLPYIFSHCISNVSISPQMKDGEVVQKDQKVCIVEGSAYGVIATERIALNLLQRLSGIATQARRYVTSLPNREVVLLDTRKTIPGWRLLEKYAVRVGGATNHRMGSFDSYLVKENHIRVAGGITAAIEKVKAHRGDQKIPIIVEVTNLKEFKEVLTLGVDRIMLDNANADFIAQAVTLAEGKIPLEISGGVNLKTLPALAKTGVNFISIGALTHSAPILNLSMQVTLL